MANPSQQDEEEYQFREAEEQHPSEKYTSPTVSSSGPEGGEGKSQAKKRILILIGVVIGIFCLYKLYGLFSAPAQKKENVPAVTQAMPAVQPLPAVVEKPAEVVTAIPEAGSVKDKVSMLEQTVNQNMKTQENLQNEIAGLSSGITEIQSNIAMLTQQINSLAQQKSETEKKIVEKEKVAVKPRPKRIRHAIARQKNAVYRDYFVKALIQGRAWLTDVNGATFTISTGDQLPGYGVIQEIDPAKGMVMTSSGRVITFMPHDR